jgi:D-alanine-D-alanine ligase
MKKKKIIRVHKRTIALLYHYVPTTIVDKYFSKEHAIVDNQTDEIVTYMQVLFKRRGYKVQVIKVEPNDLSDLKNLRCDFVFNLVDSKAMEVKIAKILDRLRIPYSGSSFEAIKTSNNKLKTKRIFEKCKLPTPQYTIIRMQDRISRRLIPCKFPIIVKPAYEHCSIGITESSIAQNYEQLKTVIKTLRKKHNQALIAEQFIPGKELQVTVLETPHQTVALPIAEITFRNKTKNRWNIYGFDEKWSKNTPVYKNCNFVSPPRRLVPAIDVQIKKDSIRAFYALGLRDYARFDLRYDPTKHQWYFLEANANAGFDPDPRDAMTASIKAHGMTLDDFVLQIVHNSLHA